MKNTLILLLVLAVLALGYFLIRKDSPDYQAPEDLGNTEIPDGEEGSETPETKDPVKKKISEDGGHFTIKAEYPVTGIDSVDSEILNFINKAIAEFKEQSGEPYPGQTAPYAFISEFKIAAGKDTTTIIFNIETYTGGAHGNLAVKTFTYDRTGKRVYLGSIFVPESAFLKKLSEISRTKLTEKLGTEGNWINDGTEPVSTNFEAFYLTLDNKLVIIFQPYQVAPWAAGLQEVVIDFDELGDIVDEKYR